MGRAANLGLLAAAGAMSLAMSARAADCTGVFLFKPSERLSVQEISRLGDGGSASGPSETALSYEVSDWEDSPARGRWELWGVVFGSIVGEGGTVAGGVLWVTNREAFGPGGGARLVKAADGVTLTITPRETPIAGCKKGLSLRFDAKGRLYANGLFVGQAQEAK